jgi:hypothetical protein
MRILAAVLLGAAAVAAAAPASARMHAPYRGHRILPANAAPLDGFTTPSGAYSFRKLTSAYAGPAIRLRRASDNLELDINFLGCTGFTGCPWDSAAALAHCAATTCFIRTWYAQAGTLDLVQTTPASQPSLIFNCNGALPCIQTTAGTFLASAATPTPSGVVSISAVGNRSAGTGLCAFRQNGNANRVSATPAVANQWQLAGTGSLAPTANDNVWHAVQGVINGAASVISIDGTETTGTVTGTVTAAAVQVTGSASTTCNFAEYVYWDPYQLTPAERTALRANQKSYWGTP